MKLIVGLGNPGKEYDQTRHNIGYDCVTAFAAANQITFKYEPSFEGMIVTYVNLGTKALLLKPTTFMNLSGRSLIKVVNYFNIKIEDILIISDDIHLDLGKIRLRYKGSSGGHNGLKDIISVLKTEQFKRLRIGISNNDELIDFVLSKFSKKERAVIETSILESLNIIHDFIHEKEFDHIMARYND